MQSFMDSFQGNGGIAEPGTYVQFFVEAAYPERAQWSLPAIRTWDLQEKTVTCVLGTTGAVVNPDPCNAVESFKDLFGAVSSEGVHLHKAPYTNDDRELATKIDMPRSYLAFSQRKVPGRIDDHVPRRNHHQVKDQADDQVKDQADDQVNDQAKDQVNDQANDQVNDQVNDQANDQANDQVNDQGAETTNKEGGA
jgi:hypothetical protein